MKKLINPPIQSLLLLGSAGLLGLAAWSLVGLKMQDENQGQAAGELSVHIPDAGVLDTPEMDAYPQMVKTPLFWTGRKAVEPPKVEAAAPVMATVDSALPEGRLIGIIDMGDHLFGIMQNSAGGSVHLKVGDTWGAWTISGIDPDRLIVALGEQKQDIPLVGDFASPQENPQVAQTKAVQQQAKQQQAAMARTKPTAQMAPVPQALAAAMPAEAMPNAADPAKQGAGLPFPADTAKQPPALSVKEALEARQRLMASRWGSLAGDAEEAPPPTPWQPAKQ